MIPEAPKEVDTTTRRRTGRVKKEPNYFNSIEYQHQVKKVGITVCPLPNLSKQAALTPVEIKLSLYDYTYVEHFISIHICMHNTKSEKCCHCGILIFIYR